MTCDDFKKSLSAYIDNELDMKSFEAVKSHIAECPDCRKLYEDMLNVHIQLQNLYSVKNLPEEFAAQLTNKLPPVKSKTNIWEVISMKKVVIPAVAAAFLLCLFILLPIGRSFSPFKSHKLADLAVIVKYNDITYMQSFSEVITDERIVGEVFGEVKYQITEKDSSERKVQNGDATMLPVGTKLYSVKGLDKNSVLAVKYNNNWLLYRSLSPAWTPYPLFTEDILTAEKVVVSTYNSTGESITKELTDKSTVTNLALGLKNAETITDHPYFSNSSTYNFYFVIKDSNGIGKIARRYSLSFQDPNFDGYISIDKTYKLKSDFNKLISAPFGPVTSSYDESLGGKQQIYSVDFFTPKLIFRRLVKEQTGDKYQVTLLDTGSQIWQDGTKVTDNLKGKYKLEIIMKNTKIKKSVLDSCSQNLSKINGAVSINFTQGDTKDTTVMYIGFDDKPDYRNDESGDAFLLLINPYLKK